jgi:hypothetical protein
MRLMISMDPLFHMMHFTRTSRRVYLFPSYNFLCNYIENFLPQTTQNGTSSRQTPSPLPRPTKLPQRPLRKTSIPCTSPVLNPLPPHILTTIIGTIRRLPPSSRLRPLGRRKKNPHRRHPKRTLRPRRRKDKDRFPRLPNHQQPQVRIQHCSLCVPS